MANQNPAIAAIAKAAMGAVTETAKDKTNKSNKLSVPAVAGMKDDITAKMEAAVAKVPEVQFVTNSEPWYTKRTRWAAIIGPATFLIGIGLRMAGVDYQFGAAEAATLADVLTAAGTAVSGIFALWAGYATKPMGS